ncbi:MAG: polysaccharide deacetylase family protein [Firmicutes bacterium]|nr:polysaccharide deacetylase family protein [Bacillota bacterium]
MGETGATRRRPSGLGFGRWAGAAGAALLAWAGVGAGTARGAPPPAIERGPAEVRAVAFACNVVWGTPYVLPIARAFRQAGGRLTFFLGGRWAASHPSEARALAAMGMEIASHGDAHRHVGRLSLVDNLTEIDRANAAIEAATGVRPRLYAPAYGEVSGAVLEAAALRSMPVVLWSVDTVDWRPSHTPEIIRRRVLARLSPGAIVLIHPTDRTLAALPALLQEIRARGYALTTVSDLMAGAREGTARRGAKGTGKRSGPAPAPSLPPGRARRMAGS